MPPENARRPTLMDVARLAGVSHMTVSRVVQGSKQVKPETARKVRQALEESGYRPDPALSALAAYRTRHEPPAHHGVLAFLDCDNSSFSKRVIEGAAREARLFGYEVERFSFLPSQDASSKSLSRMLFHRGIRGLLFGPTGKPRIFHDWDWDEFAAVSLGPLEHQPLMHAVAMDYFQSAFSGCERLRQAGCRRVGLAVGSGYDGRTGHRWLGGYLSGVHEYHEPLIFRGEGWSMASIRAWARKAKIDGVLTIHLPIQQSLQPLGKRVFFLNEWECGPGAPRLVLDPASIGGEGVRFLHNLLLRREFGLLRQPSVLSMQGEWVDT